jgi:AbrB-like transcriptional regulator
MLLLFQKVMATATEPSIEVLEDLKGVTDVSPSGDRLTGKDLLTKIKSLASETSRETIIQCGYTKPSKVDGSQRLDKAAFYDAVMEAKGINVAPKVQTARKSNRVELTVHKNGQVLIGATHVKQLGLNEGDILVMTLGSKTIKLVAA